MKKLFLCVLALLLTGCAPKQDAVTDPTFSPEVTFYGSVTETAEATVPETREETAAPTETTAPPEPQPESWKPFDENGCLNYGTVLLGDSLTYGLANYLTEKGCMGEGRYMAIAGGSLRSSYHPDYPMGGKYTRSFGGNIYSPEFEGLTMMEGMAQMGEDVRAVFLMFGTNDSAGTAGHEYITAIDQILEVCPNATVFLQTIPVAKGNQVNFGRINDLIDYVAWHYGDVGEERLVLLDTHSVFNTGHLLADGLHLGEYGQEAWHQWLMESAKEYYS